MDLYCMESMVELRAVADPTFFNNDQVLTSLLAVQDHFRPLCWYSLQIQTDINVNMRSILAGWMLEVCEAEKSEDGTFSMAVNYLDRFLSLTPTQKNHLQLLGAVCMFLAFKLKGTRPLSAERICLYTDNSISPTELLNWELVVLGKLKWDMAAVIPNDFVEHFLRRLPLTEDKLPIVRKHTQILIELCTIDEELAMKRPSLIASGSMGAAICGLKLENYDQRLTRDNLTQRLAAINDIEVTCLRECQEQIEEALAASLKKSSQAPATGKTSELQQQQQNQAQGQSNFIPPTDVQYINL
ncbi:G1/S-specific cyclin-D2-like isoform X2 [Stigmatopora nigra]